MTVDSPRASIVYRDESYATMGACFEVYKEMGCGFLEGVYQECLAIEFALRQIPFIPQSPLELNYKGQSLQQMYLPDFICFANIVLEINSVTKLDDVHRAQIHNYLKATGHWLGLLVNFGHHPLLEHERIVR
jgi:GxxExxY protein